MRHLLALGQLTFGQGLASTRKEFSNYQWIPLNYNKPQTDDKATGPDHLMDVIRYMVMELPINSFAIDQYFVPKRVYNKGNNKTGKWEFSPGF